MELKGVGRRPSTLAVGFTVALLVAGLTACGGDDSGAAVGDGAGDASDGGPESAVRTDSDAGGANSTATLTIGDEVYTWTGEQMNTCEIDGVFGPASADFGVKPNEGGTGPWMQFIHRSDGGFNSSLLLEGERFSPFFEDGPDETRPGGFTYSGTMNRSGEKLDVVLDVDC